MRNSELEEHLIGVLRMRNLAEGLELLPEPVREYRFSEARGWRFDLAWVDHKLAVEVDGGTGAKAWRHGKAGRHVRPEGYEQDAEKLNAAALAGWTVLRVTGAMVHDGRALAAIELFFRLREEAA